MSSSTGHAHHFEEARSIFGEDKADYLHFLGLVIKDLNDILQELASFLEDRSEGRYRGIRHNTLTTTRLFKLKVLDDLLNEGLAMVTANNQEGLGKLLPKISSRITTFIGVIESEIKGEA